ncbi:MAG: P1 family peptidase [Hyphomicrobiaceae bacterium]
MHNSITDIPGLKVGNAQSATLCTGVSVLLADRPFVAAVDVRGGATGTRETDAIGLAGTVDEAHAIVLSGGSAFGLAAASGVQAWLAEQGIGFAVGSARVPIVPAAILFDLLNGGNKAWDNKPPYEAMGRAACEAASATLAPGSHGAGFGATTATLRGGLGTASCRLANGLIVGALVAVNPLGSVTVGSSAHFWAGAFEQGLEFGGRGLPGAWPADGLEVRLKGTITGGFMAQNTTIAIVATNARLSKRGAHRLAVMAQTGLARAIYPVHTPLDGDVVFAAATGDVALEAGPAALAMLGAHAANTLARAVARGVYAAEATPPHWTGPPAYRTVFPG